MATATNSTPKTKKRKRPTSASSFRETSSNKWRNKNKEKPRNFKENVMKRPRKKNESRGKE